MPAHDWDPPRSRRDCVTCAPPARAGCRRAVRACGRLHRGALHEPLGRRAIGDEHVDPAGLRSAPRIAAAFACRRRCRRHDRRAAGRASSMLMTRSFSGVDDRRAVRVEEAQADVPDRAARAQRLQLLRREDVAARCQQLRRLDGADADQRDRHRLEQRRRLLDVAVLQHHPLCVGRADGARRRQQRRRAARAGSPAGASDASRAASAPGLPTPPRICTTRAPAGAWRRVHRLDHREERRAPRRDPDDVARLQRWSRGRTRPPRRGRGRSDPRCRSTSTTMASRRP